MSATLDVLCPCCGNRMKVDAATGEILAEERPVSKPSKSFEQAMTEVNTGAQKREEAFSKAADRTRNQQDLLDRKFEEARKKAADEKGRPPSIFDLE
ncbi:MAG: hypothetical protein LAO51_10970 [Acidobacteriia bacterium]|nr:hypothetical protein [Terriglobia bacterium]